MSWRSVVISRPARLRQEHFSLAIDQEETVFVPFEDIAVIVLNHREITLTHPVLSACADYGIGLYATGRNHQPTGIFLPFLQHSRSTRVWRLQQAAPRPLCKQLWASLVRRKIENQSRCLGFLKRQGCPQMDSLARQVRSGDSGHHESQASALYFQRLFGLGFYRSQDSGINAALNYGYTVIRGAIARSLVLHGLHPTIGLFHDSEQNAFNLADDLIEPFRPVVDLHVARLGFSLGEHELHTGDKAGLVALLNVDMAMPTGIMSVLSAIEHTVESLVRALETEAADVLALPELLGLHQHRVES